MKIAIDAVIRIVASVDGQPINHSLQALLHG